jgi:hypothetical protein
MTRKCLHHASIASPLVGFCRIVDSANALSLQSAGKHGEVDKSGLTRLGILCSIHLSYGGAV